MTDHSPEHLLDLATEAAGGSHSPYSRFRVGAAVVTDTGDIVTGANIENAAYGASVCAETNAITTAVAAGAASISTVAVMSLDGDFTTPCGNCRQVMREFSVERVIMQLADGSPRIMRLEELLPESFGPEDLADAAG